MLSNVTIIVGLSCMMLAFGMPSPDAPHPSWNPAKWKPIWRQRDQFSAAGWRFWTGGLSSLALGLLLRLAAWLF